MVMCITQFNNFLLWNLFKFLNKKWKGYWSDNLSLQIKLIFLNVHKIMLHLNKKLTQKIIFFHAGKQISFKPYVLGRRKRCHAPGLPQQTQTQCTGQSRGTSHHPSCSLSLSREATTLNSHHLWINLSVTIFLENQDLGFK